MSSGCIYLDDMDFNLELGTGILDRCDAAHREALLCCGSGLHMSALLVGELRLHYSEGRVYIHT